MRKNMLYIPTKHPTRLPTRGSVGLFWNGRAGIIVLALRREAKVTQDQHLPPAMWTAARGRRCV